MKSIFEFAHSIGLRGKQATEAADLIEARDAEHRAELDETRERLQECGSACGTTGNQCQGCLRRMFNREVERREAIQGELAEARGILTDWPEAPCSRLGQVVTGMAVTSCGRCLSCRRAKHLAGAPPPAESTPVPMRCTASAGSCNSPVACGEAGRCIDARMREVAGAPPDDIGARLDRLESEVRYLADTSTQGAVLTLENKVAALETHVHCRACGFILRPENALVADGCPCNSGRGVNHGLVARNTCTCAVCDPAQTGGARKPTALEAKGEPGTHADDVCSACRKTRANHVNETCDARQFVPMKGAKP